MPNNKKLSVLLSYCYLITCTCLLFSCVSKNVTKRNFIYFQTGLDSIKNIQSIEPFIQHNDVLSIQVTSSSLNQDQVIPFNPPSTTNGNGGYLVNTSGNIEMPVIGLIKAEGLTQLQLQKNILDKISPYVKDASVIVHFLQFKINFLGEVKSPGTKTFSADRVTLIDGLSAAGDLTDNGKREDITVIREEGNIRKMYKVDLRSGGLFQSPVYILQPNDIVYVGASEQKFRELKSMVAATTQKNVQIVMTFIGMITSILLAIRVFK